jgi:hypothetical protein
MSTSSACSDGLAAYATMANDSDPPESQDDAERLVLPMQELRG